MKRAKALCRVLVILIIVSVVACSVIILILPEVIPIHYNINFEVDQTGSKYTMIIFPLFAVFIGFLMIVLAKRERQQGNIKNTTILYVCGILGVFFFDVLMVFYMLKALSLSGVDLLPVICLNGHRLISTTIGEDKGTVLLS